MARVAACVGWHRCSASSSSSRGWPLGDRRCGSVDAAAWMLNEFASTCIVIMLDSSGVESGPTGVSDSSVRKQTNE